MHRVQQAIRVALYAATLAAFLDAALGDTRLPLTCKAIARDIVVNSCKGVRIKRAPLALDQVKLDEEMKIGDHKEHVKPQKRQWGFQNTPIGQYNSETQSNYDDVELKIPGMEFSDDRGSQFSENQFSLDFPGEPGGVFPESFGPGGEFFRAGSEPVARSADSRDLLGYLSPEELEELYQEIGDRMPRHSKESVNSLFRKVADKCCPNMKLCYDDPSVIPCVVY